MLFVLGEHAEHRGVDGVLGQHLPAGTALGRVRRELREQLLDLLRCAFAPHLRTDLALPLGHEDLTVGFDRSEQQVERRVVERDAIEAQVVEQVLELVGERRQSDRAEERGQALQRVHRPEHVVQHVGGRAALALGAVEREEIARQRVDELLGLREELFSRLVRGVPVAAFHDGALRLYAWRLGSSK